VLNLQDELLKFLQTQMWCHHPNGLKNGSPGAYAVDWDKWMVSEYQYNTPFKVLL
jgi:hypothetical protein